MKRLAITSALVVALVATVAAFTQLSTASPTKNVNDEGHLLLTDAQGVAVSGYDTVSYFTDGHAVKGSDQHSTRWRGATWKFATAGHLADFKADPERYAPQYGGYCAWGVAAKNDLFEIDPHAWKIAGGKLYLNFNTDVQKTWLGDIHGFIETGDQNWPGLVKKSR